MRPATSRPNLSRRGVTLLEMMVAVALLVLMMTVLVAVFQKATGAIQEFRAFAALDQDLRRLDSIIRQDLEGVTAKMTPPNDPGQQSGYFEYAENALADSQGEDTDDTLRFTAKAPAGQPFVGNLWIPKSVPASDPEYKGLRNTTYVPIRVTSDYAEIVYFLRNGNLYRRVVLIKPSLSSSSAIITPPFVSNTPNDPEIHPGNPNFRSGPSFIGFRTSMFQPLGAFSGYTTSFGSPFVSWQGMNSISAHPRPYPASKAPNTLVLHDLVLDPVTGLYKHVTDYAPELNDLGDLASRENRIFNPRAANDWTNNVDPTGTPIPDGLPDDENDMDGNGAPFEGDGVPDWPPIMYPSILGPTNNTLVNELNNSGTAATTPRFTPNYDNAAFPYVFPNAYTQPDPYSASNGLGNIHSLNPSITPVSNWNGNSAYFGTFIDPPYNHNPLDTGDSLAPPAADPSVAVQTWWGFPTWRETMSPYWLDPIKRINDPPTSNYFTTFLGPLSGADASGGGMQSPGLSYRWLFSNQPRFMLPPLNASKTIYPNPQPYADDPTSMANVNALAFTMPPNAVYEEDLIATNVRSFDVKALDLNPKMLDYANGNALVNLPPGYYDLGYANLLSGTNPLFLDCFAHEGRMPPRTADFRANPQFPGLQQNVGDDTPGLVRLRRVWDSWSTTYTNVPSMPRLPFNGPLGGNMPVFPSYPAPYPAPLRGIQIQLRIADPDGQRIKTLTIQQDFTNKL